MDYKEKYEKAIGRAEAAYGTGAYDDATLEFIFPQLRESEDERIRKRIRLCLDECVHSDIIRDYERDEVLAYLEKQKEQKEQKPKLYWHKIKAYEKLPCKAYIYKQAFEQENNFFGKATIPGFMAPNIPCGIGCDTWYLPVDDIKNLPKEGEDEFQPDTRDFDERQEQSKIDLEKEIADYWTATDWCHNIDLEKFKVIARYFFGLGLIAKEPTEVDESTKRLNENWMKQHFDEHKPAEWSELQSEFKNINEAFEDGKNEVVAHPVKYGLCKKAEWSDEDEEMLEYIIGDVNDAKQLYTTQEAKNMSDEEIAWLKSLRPQPKQEWSEVELEFRGEKVKVKRPFFRDDKGRGYSTTEQDEDVAWYALRAWCEKKGVSLYDLYPRTEWSDEDEENFKWFDKFFRAESIMLDGRDIPQDKYLWFKSLRPQPKQEWSDDIIRKAVKEVGLTQRQIDWFKANVFPPKSEWSEEDEKVLNRAINIDADKLKAEIARLRKEHTTREYRDEAALVLEDLEDYIDSIQQEQKPKVMQEVSDNVDKLRAISTPAEEDWFKIDKEWEKEDALDEFTRNIRDLITRKLSRAIKIADGSVLKTAVFIDDIAAEDIANGVLFYVGKEMMKNPQRKIPTWEDVDEEIFIEELTKLYGRVPVDRETMNIARYFYKLGKEDKR